MNMNKEKVRNGNKIKDNLPEGVKILKCLGWVHIVASAFLSIIFIISFMIYFAWQDLLLISILTCIGLVYYWVYKGLLKGKNWVRIFWMVTGVLEIIISS